MSEHATLMAEAIDRIAALVAQPGADGRRLLDDKSVAYRLGRSIARTEAALSTPRTFGRVANAQTMRDVAPDLMDVLGAASAFAGRHRCGAADDGGADHIFRLASPVGALRQHPRGVPAMLIAQHALGLRSARTIRRRVPEAQPVRSSSGENLGAELAPVAWKLRNPLMGRLSGGGSWRSSTPRPRPRRRRSPPPNRSHSAFVIAVRRGVRFSRPAGRCARATDRRIGEFPAPSRTRSRCSSVSTMWSQRPRPRRRPRGRPAVHAVIRVGRIVDERASLFSPGVYRVPRHMNEPGRL